MKTLKMPPGKDILCEECKSALNAAQLVEKEGKKLCPHCGKEIPINKEK